MRRALFVLSLVALMAASALLGWRAHITFERVDTRYIPVPVKEHWFQALALELR